jgi:taurine dioxygenase
VNVRPLTGSIGAEITGIDLHLPMSGEDAAAIRAAWQRHLVIVLPGQQLEPEQQIAFARLLGPVDTGSAVRVFSDARNPEIFVLTNETQDGKPSDTRDVGWQWHADLTYTLQPSSGAVLYALAIPDAGGDTMFANMERAYATLSPAYRDLVDRLETINDIRNGRAAKRRLGPEVPMSESFSAFLSNPPVVQPMVRVHPETGRRSLLVSETYIKQIDGMTLEESEPILRFLLAHATQPEFVYRHRWSSGDLLVWDNRSTMHKVVADHDEVVEPGAPGKVRRMHRVTLSGVPAGRLYG